MVPIKQQLHQACLAKLATKIEDLQKIIRSINDSKNNETKSSAGDKYETGRAMMQMEEDKITAQLELAQHQQSQLRQLPVDSEDTNIRLGSLATTNQRSYYLSVSLGKIVVEGETYFCISPAAPVGKLLMGKVVGDEISFNGREEKVLGLV